MILTPPARLARTHLVAFDPIDGGVAIITCDTPDAPKGRRRYTVQSPGHRPLMFNRAMLKMLLQRSVRLIARVAPISLRTWTPATADHGQLQRAQLVEAGWQQVTPATNVWTKREPLSEEGAAAGVKPNRPHSLLVVGDPSDGLDATAVLWYLPFNEKRRPWIACAGFIEAGHGWRPWTLRDELGLERTPFRATS